MIVPETPFRSFGGSFDGDFELDCLSGWVVENVAGELAGTVTGQVVVG